MIARFPNAIIGSVVSGEFYDKYQYNTHFHWEKGYTNFGHKGVKYEV